MFNFIIIKRDFDIDIAEFGDFGDPQDDKAIIVSNLLVDWYTSSNRLTQGIADIPGEGSWIALRKNIAEREFRTLSHELGHVYVPHLCEEYRYDMWLTQNKFREGGCKNTFPEPCVRDYQALQAWRAAHNGRSSGFIPPSCEGDSSSSVCYSILNSQSNLVCIKGASIMGSADTGGFFYPEMVACPLREC